MATRPKAAPKIKKRVTPRIKNTTIRDFSGGWNVSDGEQSLTSRFSPVFDNVIPFADRSVAPRFGFEMELKLKTGTVGATINRTADSVTTANASRYVNFAYSGHPFSSGDHINITNFSAALNGIPQSDFNTVHTVAKVDDNNFQIALNTPATSAGTSARNYTYYRDTHAIGGTVVESKYFDQTVIVFTSTGEIVGIDANNVIMQLWNAGIAYSYPGHPEPWHNTRIVAGDVFGKELIVSNGVDKPVRVDYTNARKVDYAIDPATASNAFIPAFNAAKSAFRYFIVHDTAATKETEARISAKNTSVVYSDTTPDPIDAVDVDVSKVVPSVERTIIAYAQIKNNLMAIMPSATALLQLGIYIDTGTAVIHEPDPVDSMVGLGTSAMRSVIEVASDVFMIDYSGVPSAKLSALTNAVVPSRVSSLIEPSMAAHLGRLTKDTLRYKAFGVYDGKNRCLHFYIPKYDETDTRNLYTDPFSFDIDLSGQSILQMRCKDHQFAIGDFIVVSGAVGFSTITAEQINGTREVVGVLDEDYVLITTDAVLPEVNANGGGSSVVLRPVNDETIGYIYHYQPTAKLQAWSRFRGVKWNCGCGTVEGKALFFTDDKMYRYGSRDAPVYADGFGDFDFLTWVSGTSYAEGDRVRDTADGRIYQVIAAHVSTAVSFQAARDAAPDNWEEYIGEPIVFSWELPWSDLGARQLQKALRFIHIDAGGEEQFTVDAFVDGQYINTSTGVAEPARSITFVGSDARAYGAGQQVYGGGRRTREQLIWAYQARFKLLKIRLRGESRKHVHFSALSFMYLPGGFIRG